MQSPASIPRSDRYFLKRVFRASRFLFYPLPFLIILNIVCITHFLHAARVRLGLIVVTDLFVAASPFVVFYFVTRWAKRKVKREFRDGIVM